MWRPLKEKHVLLAEDDEGHAIITQQAFLDNTSDVQVHWVEDGLQCMKFLRKQDPYTDAPTPDLILLDLNMPSMDGREVLHKLVNDPDLRHLPVVVLTTSCNDQDVLDMYRMRCSSFMVKPADFDDFARFITMLDEYWFLYSILPSRGNDDRAAA